MLSLQNVYIQNQEEDADLSVYEQLKILMSSHSIIFVENLDAILIGVQSILL